LKINEIGSPRAAAADAMTTDAQIITAGQNGRDGVPDGARRAIESAPASRWQIITLVLWVACLSVGVLGLWLRYRLPRPPPGATEPVQAQLITVEVSNDPSVLADSGPPRARDNLEPPPDRAALPQAPPLPAVASPSPEVAFALPVVGPTRTVAKDLIDQMKAMVSEWIFGNLYCRNRSHPQGSRFEHTIAVPP
jgi:hypothetical protein